MKIESFSILNNTFNKQNRSSQVYKTNSLEKQPCRDTISFRASTKFNKSLYRAINVEELKVLLQGIPVGNYKYVTTNPMGFGATNWANGFANSKKDTFFIKFKNNHFNFIEIQDRRDDPNDTRFVIRKNVTIDDVDSIYKGHNINGEMIWPKNKALKLEDKNKKLYRIYEIFKELENNSSNIKNLIIELGSYTREFPSIISVLMKNKNISLSSYDLSYLINESKNAQYYTYIKESLKNSITDSDKTLISPFAIDYMSDFAKKEDLALVLEVLKRDTEKNIHGYPKLISEIASKKDITILEKIFNEGDYSMKNILLLTFKNLDSKKITKKKAIDFCEKLLNEIKDFKEEDYKNNADLCNLLFTCTYILDENNAYLNFKPELIKVFCNLNLGTDPDFKFYYTELTK